MIEFKWSSPYKVILGPSGQMAQVIWGGAKVRGLRVDQVA